MSIHAYTSFSYSYLNRARVWAKSLKRIHPEWVLWAIISDVEPNGFIFDINQEPFDKALNITDLYGEETESWVFGMDVIETCTAVKGRALRYILEQPNVEIALYFDPDTAVFNSIDSVCERLLRKSILLTPHQVDPESDEDNIGIRDNEMASLQYGVFNLGFIAVANDSEAKRFSAWWAERLDKYCYDQLDLGLFVDQKWCNLVPCFFDGVEIDRDPGLNVASWNLSKRRLSINEAGMILVNGSPLKFFHFTKLGPIGDVMTSRYAKNNTEVYEIWSAYRRWIVRETEYAIDPRHWHYSKFSNGVHVKKKLRELYRQRKDLRDAFKNPLEQYHEIRQWAIHEERLELLD